MIRLPSLWIRSESRSDERRVAIVPEDARRLVAQGIKVTVEESPQRIFPVADYVAAGCAVAEPGTWVAAPDDQVIIGLKALPESPAALRHRHIFFGHAYKGQPGAEELLRRFARGRGELLDLEYLTDATGRRLAAFGYWAGYVGAALAVLHARRQLRRPLESTELSLLEDALSRDASGVGRVVVIGAWGRCGSGARAALAAAGITPTCWDIEETRQFDKAALLEHDIMINAVYTVGPTTPFLTLDDIANPNRRLITVADITCDAGSPYSVLPIYESATNWHAPVLRLLDDERPLDVIAIDNLPSLLPKDASIRFSADLTPHLFDLHSEPWSRCSALFTAKLRSVRPPGTPRR